MSAYQSTTNTEIQDSKENVNDKAAAKGNIIIENPAPLLMGMFVIILFGARISGSHYNPLITFSYMIGNVRQGKFDRLLGAFYIMS